MAIESVLTPASLLYKEDFIAWTELMSAALERRDVSDLDWEHLAEEIRDLGISQKRSLTSHLENVMLHLIKWEIQPERRSGSWEDSISNSRGEVDSLLDSIRSLRGCLLESFDRCYNRAGRKALRETHLEKAVFTRWTLDQVLDPGFLPE